MHLFRAWQTVTVTSLNPLEGRDVSWLHLAIQVEPTFLISDIRALWRSWLSARVPECQKLKCWLDLDGTEHLLV